MDNSQLLVLSAYVTCFRNVVNAQRLASKLSFIKESDEYWVGTFKNAALEPDFGKFLDSVMYKSDCDNKYIKGKAERAWRVAWLLARTFESNFQPVKQETEDAAN